MTTKIKSEPGISKIRVSTAYAKKIKVSAAQNNRDMVAQADIILEAGLKALKIK